jgi:hypothetical protein
LKKAFPYIAGLLVLIAMIFLTFGVKRERRFDGRITFKKEDKIPYGTYAAYHHLPYLFPDAEIIRNVRSPEHWDTTYYEEKAKKAIVIITPQFIANEGEMNSLLAFAQKGNDVFISTREASIAAQDFLKLRSSSSFDAIEVKDSVTLTLDSPPFPIALSRTYPGIKYQSYLYKYDSNVTSVIGRNHEQDPVFIHLVTGKGNVYLHVAPIAFTNYFLLHKKNIAYYNEALSVIKQDTKKLIWDDFFLYKLYERRESSNWLAILFRYPAFRWALLTAILTIIIYGLLEMRRRQRYIPAFIKPKNDSLDFVKTIGRLYHEKNDHRDLGKKMSMYFLEHVRNRYKISTSKLDGEFVKLLHYKTGYKETELQQIVSFISFVDTAPGVSDAQLAKFHGQLENFYKQT